MGLDLVPLGRPKPGHEEAWAAAMVRVYALEEETPEQQEQRRAASLEPYEVVGAPRVGESPEATQHMLSRKAPDASISDADFLAEFHGYYVLELAPACDGIPPYSNAALYRDIDETSFRGTFLNACGDLLAKETLERAWTDGMPPEEAVAYGQELLKCAERPVLVAGTDKSTGSFTKMLGSKADHDQAAPIDEQRNILRAAGRWYIYWGERGHPIWAWY